jgi:choline dehydrogenase-like flavoprotein
MTVCDDDTVVVDSGVASVTAARELADRDLAVALLEASERVEERAHSWPFMGTPQGPPLCAVANVDDPVWAEWMDGAAPRGDGPPHRVWADIGHRDCRAHP